MYTQLLHWSVSVVMGLYYELWFKYMPIKSNCVQVVTILYKVYIWKISSV